MWAKFTQHLGREVDGASLAFVRMVTAAALFSLSVGVLAGGRVHELFMQDGVRFHYPLTEFVRPLPGNLPYAHMVLIAVTALAVFVGWRTRLNAVLLAAGTVYWFLLDPLQYTDGYYLLMLMSVLIAWLPVNRWMSADRQMKREPRSTVLGWQPWLVQMQMLCVYFFSGLSKLNGDWLSGAPLAERLLSSRLPVSETTAIALAWGFALSQLAVGFLLLWRPTRWFGLGLMTLLHIADATWLRIGDLSLLVWAWSLIFCTPDWPRRLVDRMAPAVSRWSFAQTIWNGVRRVGRGIDAAFAWFDDSPVFKKKSPAARPVGSGGAGKVKGPLNTGELMKYAVAAWLALQIAAPMRQFVYPGNPRWTDSGRLFGWWGNTIEKEADLLLTMKLPDRSLMWRIDPQGSFPVPLDILFPQDEMDRRGLGGGTLADIVLAVEDPEMKDIVNARIESAGLSPEDVVRLDEASYQIAMLRLTDPQLAAIGRRPELLRQYCVLIARTVAQIDRRGRAPRVFAAMQASLNGRDWSVLVPQDTELSAERFSLGPTRWMAPLKESLPPLDQRLAFEAEIRSRDTGTVESAPSSDKPKRAEPNLAPGISDEDEQWFQSQQHPQMTDAIP